MHKVFNLISREDLKNRIEELEQQNAFECQCVSDRDKLLKSIRRKIIVEIFPRAINDAEVQRDLLNILKMIEEVVQ